MDLWPLSVIVFSSTSVFAQLPVSNVKIRTRDCERSGEERQRKKKLKQCLPLCLIAHMLLTRVYSLHCAPPPSSPPPTMSCFMSNIRLINRTWLNWEEWRFSRQFVSKMVAECEYKLVSQSAFITVYSPGTQAFVKFNTTKIKKTKHLIRSIFLCTLISRGKTPGVPHLPLFRYFKLYSCYLFLKHKSLCLYISKADRKPWSTIARFQFIPWGITVSALHLHR